jgi:putative transposase
MITDKLTSYGAAKSEIIPAIEHRQHKGLNNREEKFAPADATTRVQMKQFKSAGQAQRFLSAHDQINNLFHLRRDRVTAAEHRGAGRQTFRVWAEIGSLISTADVPCRVARIRLTPTRTS